MSLKPFTNLTLEFDYQYYLTHLNLIGGICLSILLTIWLSSDITLNDF